MPPLLPTRHQVPEEIVDRQTQTHLNGICDLANPETTPLDTAMLESPLSITECFNALQPEQDGTLMGMVNYLLHQNLLEPPAPLISAASPASVSSESPLSSASSFDLAPNTPLDGNADELFYVENGCEASSSDPEYLSHTSLRRC